MLKGTIQSISILLSIAWIAISLDNPFTKVQDPYGYNYLILIIFINLLFFILAIISLVLSIKHIISWFFTICLFAVTPFHLVGSIFEVPTCLILFFIPFFFLAYSVVRDYIPNKAIHSDGQVPRIT